MELVSVVVPAYNAENTLSECINSILNQTYTNIEVIIINDGSTDDTWNKCETLMEQDNRVKAFSQSNQGVSAARNNGIEKVSGKYLLFIDSDDTVESTYVECLVNGFENNSEYDNVWCTIDISGLEQDDFEEKTFYKNQIMSMYSNPKYCFGSPCNKIYDLDTIKDNHITMPLNISLGEDLIFNLKYLEHNNGKILVINQALYNYKEDDNNSLSKKYRKDLFEVNNIVNSNIREKLELWNAPEEEFELLERKEFMNYQDAMFNEMVEQNTDSLRSKIKFNNNILADKYFQYLLKKYSNTINSIMAKLYRLKNYYLIYFLLKFVKR